MLAGLGVLAGVAAARFMKASSDQRYSDSRRATERGAPYRYRHTRRQADVAAAAGDRSAGPYASTR